MAHFAAKGHAVYAVSLRGTSGSPQVLNPHPSSLLLDYSQAKS
jgi:hypothetical protein